MKITCFALKLNLVDGGGSNYALDTQLRYLVKIGHEVELITLLSERNKIAGPTPYQINSTYHSPSLNFLSLQDYAYQIMLSKEQATDLFYLDGQSLLWGAGKYRYKNGKRPIAAYVNNYTAGMNLSHTLVKNAWWFWLKRWIWEKLVGLRWANTIDLIIFNSPVIKKHYADYGLKAKKTVVLPLEMQITEKTWSPLSNPFPKNESKIHLLYAGRLVQDKGLDLLIQALYEPRLIDQFVLHVVGEGSEKEKLLTLVQKHNLTKQIIFYPWISPDTLQQFYAAADIFVHPCRWPEPFGRTVVEAMTHGKPVITSSHSGSAWIIGSTGKTFSQNSVSELQTALLYFTQPGIITTQAELAKKRALEFDFNNFAPTFVNELNTLVDQAN